MAPTEGKKAKGVKATTEPSQASIEEPPKPTNGNGKFYYPNGATYEGEWMIAPSSDEDADLEAKNEKGSKDHKKGDKSSKDDSKKKGKGDPKVPAKVDEKSPPKSPKKEAADINKADKSGDKASSPSSDSNLPQQQEEHARPNHIRHGKGVYIDGEYHYEGEWKDDKICGQGTFTYASGATYVGNWDNNRYSGDGEYKWGDGRSYKGYWRESKMHGIGVYVDQSGQRYVGHFFNGIGPGLSCDIK